MLSLCLLSASALPPGYEDEAWCPPDHCIRATPQEPGFVGPRSMFVECANVKCGETADEFWTGTRTDTPPPPGWVKAKSFLDTSFKTTECSTSTAVLSAANSACAGSFCGATCIVEGDMAGICDTVGACLFQHNDIKCTGQTFGGQKVTTVYLDTDLTPNDIKPSFWARLRTKVAGLIRLR